MTERRRKIVVAMSGGVDSSVAAALLKEAGHEVIGLFMRSGVTAEDSAPLSDAGEAATGEASTCDAAAGACPEATATRPAAPPDRPQTCCSETDALDARRVADQLGIPFYVLNFADGFDRLISYFVDEYGRGRTPNPCIVCNRDLKFGRLFDYADAVGADLVATGHYARVEQSPGNEATLLRGLDRQKDQSYVLFPIERRRLGRIVFPLGDQPKSATRRQARERQLLVRDKDESQEVCFVSGDYIDLIRRRRPELLLPGPIVDEVTGREVGRHEGIAGFTVGQRKGVRVAFGEPRYVTRVEADSATVYVGRSEQLLAAGLLVEDVSWLLTAPPVGLLAAEVQIRYHHHAAPGTLQVLGNGAGLPGPQRGLASGVGTVAVRFAEAQRAVTPGQAAVFYQGDRVLGGGWIARALSATELAEVGL